MDKDHKLLNDYANDLYLAADQLGLSEWEKDFVFDMIAKREYSQKQADVILKLAEKHEV